MKFLLIPAAVALLLAAGSARAAGAPDVGTSFTGQTADFTVEAAAQGLYMKGWTVREDAGTPAVATVVIRHDADGTCNSGLVIAFVELDANQSSSMDYGDVGLHTNKGVCVDVLAGSVSFGASFRR